MLRRKKSDVLKELKDKVRYPEVIAADENFYKSELDKIWKNKPKQSLKKFYILNNKNTGENYKNMYLLKDLFTLVSILMKILKVLDYIFL